MIKAKSRFISDPKGCHLDFDHKLQCVIGAPNHCLYADFPNCFAHSLTGCKAYSKELLILGSEFEYNYGCLKSE